MSSHSQIVDIICGSFISEDGLLRTEPSPEFLASLEAMGHPSRDVYFFLTWGSETGVILRPLKERIAERLTARLQELFQEQEGAIPFVVLAQHVASSIVSLSSWWLDKRTHLYDPGTGKHAASDESSHFATGIA